MHRHVVGFFVCLLFNLDIEHYGSMKIMGELKITVHELKFS